jgi:hypothetical protein
MTLEEAHDRRTAAYHMAGYCRSVAQRNARNPTEHARAEIRYRLAIREADYAWVNDVAAAIQQIGDEIKCHGTMC